ncbi:MAG: hypothetical protein EXS43_10475 [Opitutus sp.]|nr:hypothetical protein [Opitutus sp.]
MKFLVLVWVGALGLLLAGSGCEHINITPEGNPSRVLHGVVSLPSALPVGTEILVRLLDLTPAEKTGTYAPGDLPLGDRGRPPVVERVLGEYRATLDARSTEPVPSEIADEAEDSLLRQGLNVDVRVSFGGRVATVRFARMSSRWPRPRFGTKLKSSRCSRSRNNAAPTAKRVLLRTARNVSSRSPARESRAVLLSMTESRVSRSGRQRGCFLGVAK